MLNDWKIDDIGVPEHLSRLVKHNNGKTYQDLEEYLNNKLPITYIAKLFGGRDRRTIEDWINRDENLSSIYSANYHKRKYSRS